MTVHKQSSLIDSLDEQHTLGNLPPSPVYHYPFNHFAKQLPFYIPEHSLVVLFSLLLLPKS